MPSNCDLNTLQKTKIVVQYCPCKCMECSLGDAEGCCCPTPECSLHENDPIIEMMYGLINDRIDRIGNRR